MRTIWQFMRAMACAAAMVLLAGGGAASASDGSASAGIIRDWHRLVLELVRHTPTYSPPVAARSFAYLGVTTYEAAASGSPALLTLAGQLNGLAPGPHPPSGELAGAVVVQAALASAVRLQFGNTGPTGQRAMDAMERRLDERAAQGVDPDVAERSRHFGRAIADHIHRWSLGDGGAVVTNMGFPHAYTLKEGPAHWVPTSLISQQQTPLLPVWGDNRPFAMPQGVSCPLPAPPAYSEAVGSAFHAEALEVYEAVRNLTPEQMAIARFWSDDPMLSPTPPGHWISIALDILDQRDAGTEETIDVLARLGITMADAFIGCWAAKFEYDLLRPVTYIRRHIDPSWEPPLITPPFPEYPSGHSTQSGAAATVLTALLGEDFAFEDRTHEDDGLDVRTYPSFWAAAEEAGISRLYGGIHFRAAIERGLDQGRCVGAFTNTLTTRR